MRSKLFIRSNKGIYFTGAGECLLAYADPVLQQDASIKETVRQFGQGVTGTIRLGTSYVFLSKFLPGQLRDFYNRYPGVCVSLISLSNTEMLGMLKNGLLLAAVIRGEHTWDKNQFHLYDDPLVLISSCPIDVNALQRIPYIPYSYEADLRQTLGEWIGRTFSKPLLTTTDASQAKGPHICIQLVRAGLGWSIVPLSRTLGVDGLQKLPIKDARGKPYTRRTSLLYTELAKSIDSYAVYIDSFCEYFSRYPFPKP
jgi:DNA-binding transcriptional LysR family regulator